MVRPLNDIADLPLDKWLLVEASAGTGKTYTIEKYIGRIIREKKIPGESILVVTFTRLATAELQARIAAECGSDNLPEIRTMDSWCKRVWESSTALPEAAGAEFISDASLHFQARRIAYNIITSDPQGVAAFCVRLKPDVLSPQAGSFSTLLAELMQDGGLPWKIGDFARELANKIGAISGNDNLNERSDWDNIFEQFQDILEDSENEAGKSISSYVGGVFPLYLWSEVAFRVYAGMKEQGLFSYSRYLHELAAYFRNNPESQDLQDLRNKYQYIIIDEFQDTDMSQWDIFSSIAAYQDNVLTVVGDPKQAIYRFRGSDLNVYFTARKVIEERGAVFFLGKNYRSAPEIIKFYNAVFADQWFTNGPWHAEYMRKATKEDRPDTSRLVRVEPDEELRLNAPEYYSIQSGLQNTDPGKVKITVAEKPKDTGQERTRPAVLAALVNDATALYRSASADNLRIGILASTSAILQTIRSMLIYNRVPCELATSWEQMPEATELSLLLDVVAGDRSVEALRPTRYSDSQGILHAAVPLKQLTEWAHAREWSRFFGNIRYLGDYRDQLEAESGRSGVAVWEEVLQEISLFAIREKPDLLTLREEFSRMRSRHFVSDEEPSDRVYPDDGHHPVQLMTVHKSKGLEFDHLFCMMPDMDSEKNVVGLTGQVSVLRNGFLVSRLSVCGTGSYNQQLAAEDAEEKSRLWYVALTRAKKSLNVYLGMSRNKPKKEDDLNIYELLRDKMLAAVQTLREASREIIILQEIIPQALSRLDELPKKTSGADLAHPGFPQLNGLNLHSYTSLSRFVSSGRGSNPSEQEKSAATRPEFPAGKEFGIALHRIMERLQLEDSLTALSGYETYQQLPENVKEILVSGLSSFYDPDGSLPERTAMRLSGLMNIPVSGAEFVLRDIVSGQALPEAEFRLQADTLPDEIRSRIDPTGRLSPGDQITGSIDLFCKIKGKFYCIDWKSNQIPALETAAEEEAAIRQSITDNHYDLQAEIYSSAARSYISTSGYDEKHWGGMVFIYFRARHIAGICLG